MKAGDALILPTWTGGAFCAVIGQVGPVVVVLSQAGEFRRVDVDLAKDLAEAIEEWAVIPDAAPK